MTASPIDFFKSFYYTNTYLPPVDLSNEAIEQDLLSTTNPEVAEKAQELISQDEVQEILSAPFTYDPAEFKTRGETLKRHNFKLLSLKPALENGVVKGLHPYYSVVEHNDLPGWIIKAGGTRVKNDDFIAGPMNNRNEIGFFTEEDGLLRIAMAKRMRETAAKINFELIIPEKKFVSYKNSETITNPMEKYCVVCEKLDLYSQEETIEEFKKMTPDVQRETAKKICQFIKESGFTDASLHNIRLTKEGKKFAIVDTEPSGLLVSNQISSRGKHPSSVEKCARIGLFALLASSSKPENRTRHVGPIQVNTVTYKPAKGLEPFYNQVKEEYTTACSPKLDKWKIGLSIAIPVIPAVLLVVSIAKSIFAFYVLLAASVRNVQQKKNQGHIVLNKNQVHLSLKDNSQHQKKAQQLTKLYYQQIEGVPYNNPNMVIA